MEQQLLVIFFWFLPTLFAFVEFSFIRLLLNFNIIIFIVMGQESTRQSFTVEPGRSHSQIKRMSKQLQAPSLKHQGLLRIAKTPFKNCQQIQINQETYFIQQTKTGLKDLIISKRRAGKRFSEQQILRLIQNLAYSLAYLQNVNAPYPHLMVDNIFCCRKAFKLLPPSMLKGETYNKLKQCLKQKTKQYCAASPEMIIAARCQEPTINEVQILLKSNVFALGMVMLQACTLKPSSQCYDLLTYDILDQVVTNRLQQVQSTYSKKVIKIIANMLDYDFQERMTPKQLSIWVNRVINEAEPEAQQNVGHNFPEQAQLQTNLQEQIVNSRLVEQHEIKVSKQRQPSQQKAQIKKNIRMQEIRAKINKEKVAAQMQAIQQKQLSKSRNISRSPALRQKNKKTLPNPYYNHDYLQKSAQKTRTAQNNISLHNNYANYPNNKQNVYQQEKRKANYAQPKYQYSNNYTKEQPVNKNMNLKYKYNLQDQSYQLSSNRKKESDRQIRVENELQNYKRSLSGRKYDCSINQKDEDKKDIIRPWEIDEQIEKQSKPVVQKQARNYDKQYKQYKQMEKISKPVLQQKVDYTNYEKDENKKYEKNKNMRPNPYQNIYQRHQNIFDEQNKAVKKSKRQNEDIALIKREIQKSRKIIQQVRKSENQNEYMGA